MWPGFGSRLMHFSCFRWLPFFLQRRSSYAYAVLPASRGFFVAAAALGGGASFFFSHARGCAFQGAAGQKLRLPSRQQASWLNAVSTLGSEPSDRNPHPREAIFGSPLRGACE